MQNVNVTLTEFDIKPETIQVKAGDTVKFTVTNTGRIGHDFFIEGLNIGVRDMQPGDVRTFEFVFPEPKVYTTICHHLGHALLGMKGKLIVE